jgi:hypothetical protein
MLEGEATTVLSQVGSTFRALDHMTFPMGDGVAGWVNQGHPEVLISDARSSETMSRDIAIKQRIGSVMIVPILYEEGPFGFLTVTTNRVHGIDDAMVETLRLSGAELGHALGRLAMESKKVFGLATPSEFFKAVSHSDEGHLVYLEVLRKEDVIEQIGRPQFEATMRKLAARMRTALPVNGLLCRRVEGDFVVYVPTPDEAEARKWANKATAAASLCSFGAIDSKYQTPVALRSRVARMAQQSNLIS